jgi:hypothetical protein
MHLHWLSEERGREIQRGMYESFTFKMGPTFRENSYLEACC